MRIGALIKRIIRQFFRDKRTLGMIIVAPIFILWLVSLVFSGEQVEPQLGIVNGDISNFVGAEVFVGEAVNKLEGAEIYDNEADAKKALVTGDIHGYINLNEIPPVIVVEGSDPTMNQAVLLSFQQGLQGETTLNPEVIYYYGTAEMSTFDNIGPFLIGFFVFFFVFIIAGVSFLRERTTGTLEKLLSTPLKRWEIVVGYVAGFGIFTTIQTAIIVFFSIEVLGMVMTGSIWLVMLVTLALSITALTLGTLLSAFARNELQMIQFIPVVIVPQVFFSGLFNIDAMSPWLKSLSIVMPLTYGGEAMRDIMIRGKGLGDVYVSFLILVGFSLVFMLLNNFALKKHRKI